MDGDIDYGAIAGMIAQIAGKAAADKASQMDQATIMALLQSSVDDYGKINVPKLQDLLTKAPDTQLANIKDNPQYLAQQQAADAQLNDIINSGGLTLSDKATLNNIRAKVLQGESAAQGNLTNQMAQRGSLDSGNQLAMALQNQQQGAQDLNAAGENAAAQAQARMYAAIQQRAQLAGQGLDRSYNQQANAARAQDAINQGNAAIARSGVQQDFQNQMSLANGKLNPTRALASQKAADAQQNRNNTIDTSNQAGSALSAFSKLFGGSSGGKGNNNNSGSDPSATAGNNVPEYPDDSPSSNIGAGDLGAGMDEGFGDYPGDSGALSGQSTRNQGQSSDTPGSSDVIVGYHANGTPIYGYRKAQ